ncbi:thioredoxin-dependent thiol peroxidase [bacterium]|nr:thioredoxin-dependent thiol peroxidase [bacterium]
MAKLLEGKKAPSFEYTNLKGKKISLDDFLGFKVLIYFYPRDNTPGCTKQACSLRDSMNLLKKMNIKVIGVSKDSEKSHINFTSKYDLNFDLVSDESKKIIKLYGVLNEKGSASRKSFLLDEKHRILKIWDKVKTAEHAEEVLEFLNS